MENNLIYIILFVIMVINFMVFAMYNKLIKLQNKVKKHKSNIEIYLNKRFDLIPNLVETVKGYSKHESTTLEDITALRSNYYDNHNLTMHEAEEMNNKLNKLLAVVENYPDLKANAQYMSLQSELRSIEDELGYIHICCIDFRGKITYIKYTNNKPIYKKLIYICNFKNIESIKFNLYNNLLNIFLVRNSDIFHIKYDLIYCTYNKFTLSNLMFNNLSCYIACKKHNLLVLELRYINDNINIENKLFFDNNNNSWSSFNTFSLNSNLLNYHKSLKYK
jgi:LemA protein